MAFGGRLAVAKGQGTGLKERVSVWRSSGLVFLQTNQHRIVFALGSVRSVHVSTA
jgi:hypothetical protein